MSEIYDDCIIRSLTAVLAIGVKSFVGKTNQKLYFLMLKQISSRTAENGQRSGGGVV